MKRQRSNIAYRKVYSWLIKYVVLLFVCALFGLCTVYLYFYSQSSINEIILDEPKQVPPKAEKLIFEGQKYVHLDLKGAPPLLSYYNYFFPLLAKIGATGVVIEYEDMFPYEGALLKNISALNAYTISDIKHINNLAKVNGLEVIPLVQTFGHLEFVLKLEKFKSLREVPEFPEVLCPSNKNSMEVITDMISQVLEAHPYSKLIHIGADETYYLGRCSQCVKRMRTQKITKERLYIKHIKDVYSFIKQKYPQINVLIWDDQLRYLSEEEMRLEMNDFKVTPVVWQYETDVFDKLGPSLWNQYSKLFPKVWIASAFKGATGVDQYIVNVGYHTQNHRSWISIIENYKYFVNFEAIILTGWQRYDHFSVLCELLPVALPSLIINMKILTDKEGNLLGPPKEVAELLKCEQPYALMGPSFGTPKCSFPGSGILENVYRLHLLKEDFEQLKQNSEIRGWMSSFNSYYNFSNLGHIFKISPQLNHFDKEVKEIRKEISDALLEVYDVYTMNEWIATYVNPLEKEISELLNYKKRILNKKIWPRRPVNYNVLA